MRGTFTHNNLDFSKDVLHLADLGFKQISVEPVVAQETDSYAIREEDLPQLMEEYENLALEMVKRHGKENDFNFFHFMIDLEGGPCVAKRLSGCGSGTEYLAVTPTGDLYPCHQFVGNTDFLMGNVDDGVVNTDLRDEFKSCNVYAKDKCRECFARFYLVIATYIQKKSAKTVFQNFIVVVDVQPILTTSMAISIMHTI